AKKSSVANRAFAPKPPDARFTLERAKSGRASVWGGVASLIVVDRLVTSEITQYRGTAYPRMTTGLALPTPPGHVSSTIAEQTLGMTVPRLKEEGTIGALDDVQHSDVV